MSKHLSPEIRVPIEPDNCAIMRDEAKCIKCGRCRDICTDYINVLGRYDLAKTGDTAICIHCGQCANVCPADSITERYEWEAVERAIADPDKIVIFSTSPSVRVAIGEAFGLGSAFVEGKLVSLLRTLGADYVLDTNFAADLTITEEAAELVERIAKGAGPLPQFTSCCPAWVKYAETYHPELLPCISTAKSPIGMQGPTVKTYFAKAVNIDPLKIANVAVTPCTAKKYEIRRGDMHAAANHLGADMCDMDHVITTRELAAWAKKRGIDFSALADSSYDSLMGEASGAGVIFGNTGGVMEAALRTAYFYLTGANPPERLFSLSEVRGMDGVREASFDIKGAEINVAVVYGTKNAETLIEKLQRGEKQYHFVEVMTCPGGCIGGGGQPKASDVYDEAEKKLRLEQRIGGLYRRDDSLPAPRRLSHENSELKAVYAGFYGKPLSELSKKMLHTAYEDKSCMLGK